MFSRLMDSWRRRRARAQLVRIGTIPALEYAESGVPLDHSKVLAGCLIVLLWSISSLLLTCAQQNTQDKSLPVLNQRASKTVNADFAFHYDDLRATEAAKNAARQQEPKFFSISSSASLAMRSRMNLFFKSLRDYPNSIDNAPDAVRIAELPENVRSVFRECLQNSSSRRYLNEVWEQLLNSGIFSCRDRLELTASAKVQIADLQRRFRHPRAADEIPTQQSAARKLAEAVMRFQYRGNDYAAVTAAVTAVFAKQIGPDGTLRFERQMSQDAAEAAAARVTTVVQEFLRNQTIVRKGDIIDLHRQELLKYYFEQKTLRERPEELMINLIRNMFWSIVMVLMGGFYLHYLHRDILQRNRNLAILAAVMILSLAADYWGISFFRYIARDSADLPPSLIIDAVPVGLAAVLLSPIMGFRVGLCAGFFAASSAALMLDLPYEYALKGIVISFLSAMAVRHATNYRAYFLWILFSVTPLVWLLNSDLFAKVKTLDASPRLLEQTCEISLLNGLGTSVLALLLIFCFELVFHVSTNMSLMLLCDFNHPLLERMKREAPGTFFHSLTVATLAEDGARAIDANYLQAKAGALFHDIGKLMQPQYFTENNQNTANQHTALTPQMSSIIIRDHVKDGLALARKYKLGQVVSAAIAQHHGKDLVHFFYREALENAKRTGETVDEEMFRYPGPRPQNKETAIISLADVCEAASRSMEKPTPDALEALVSRIFEQRFRDGQLCEANITLAELEKVRESFINTLLSMKHGRIAYREEEEDEHGDPLPLESFRRTAAEESGGSARA